MSDAICCVPVSPLRAEASHRSEIVSQQVFGEQCRVLEKIKDWTRISCNYDQYEGWCQPHHLHYISAAIEDSVGLTREWVTKILFNGQDMHIPYGSRLPGLKNGLADWDGIQVKYQGELHKPGSVEFNDASLRNAAMTFLNTSYLWGGKSIFGIDCSGFCQTVFKFFGIFLMRDAYQQATQGEVVGFLQEAKPGDLAFFDNAEGRITHVGILLNDHEIIHSSSKVRIDSIDSMGIINRETRERTHQLRIIKRLVQYKPI